MGFIGFTILTHHNDYYGPHVSVYYPDFDTFTRDCETVSPDSEDCFTAANLCFSMSQTYNSEKERVDAFFQVLRPYFNGIELIIDRQISTGFCDLVAVKNSILLLLEAKGEVGLGSCDSLSEAAAYM